MVYNYFMDIARRYFDSFQIKLIAACAMLIDHTAHMFFPTAIYMRCLGRIAFPIFAFMVAEGYLRTRSVEKYMIRMLIFAVIAQAPYSIMLKSVGVFQINVIFTLLLGLASIYAIEKGNSFIGLAAPIIFAIIAELAHFDHGAFGVLMVTAFFYTKNSKFSRNTAASLLILLFSASYMLRYGINNYVWIIIAFYFLPLPIINLYNRKKGIANAFSRWFFYVFYPLHIIVLLIIDKLV